MSMLSVDGILDEDLSAGAEVTPQLLDSCFDRLTDRCEAAKVALYGAVKDYYSARDTNTEPSDTIGSSLRQLPHDPSTPEATIADLAAKHASISLQLHTTDAALTILKEVASLGEHIDAYEQHTQKGAYAEASHDLNAQKEVLTRLAAIESQSLAAAAADCDQSMSSSATELVGTLQEAVTDRTSTLKAKLEEAVAGAVVVEVGRGLVTVHRSGGSLPNVWRGMQAEGLLAPYLHALADSLQENLLVPTLHTAVRPKESSSPPSGSKQLCWTPCPSAEGAPACPPPSQATVDALACVLKFVATHILSGDAALTAQLGSLLWPRFATLVTSQWLHPFAPKNPADVPKFEAPSQHARALESLAEDLGLVPQTHSPAPIASAIAKMQSRYAYARRQAVLAEARALALDPALIGPQARCSLAPLPAGHPTQEPPAGSAPKARKGGGEAGAEGAVLGLGPAARQAVAQVLPEGRRACMPAAAAPCVVTRAAEQLGQVLTRALQEAAGAGPAVARELCTAVLEVPDLFLAVSPGLRRQAPEAELLQLAMVHRNDCLHLAMHLLALHFHHSGRLKAALGRAPSILAGGKLMHAAAMRAETEAIQRQQAVVVQAVEKAGGLDGLSSEERRSAVHRCIHQALHAVQQAATTWRPVLPPRTLVAALASLMEALCSHVLALFFAISDIDVDESEQLQKVLEIILECDVLEAKPSPEARGAEGPEGCAEPDLQTTTVTETEVLERVASWVKVKEVAAMLDAPMVEITQRWEEGRLEAAGFQAKEVRHMVCAIFESTSLRDDCLKRIQ